MPPRRPLAALPTPLQRLDRLSAAWRGPTIWVKRDDLTGFGLSGNKVRKLEFHVAAARDAAADVLLTCGAVQSNHCRATAIAAARLGLDSVLFLRAESGKAPVRPEGNHLISLLAGADVRFVDREWYEARDTNMAETAARLEAGGRRPWVIPEGASDGLGMWGYVHAAAELDAQLAEAGVAGGVQWHAASSGGTTAGLAFHAARSGQTNRIVAISVSDPVASLQRRIESIWNEALGSGADLQAAPGLEIRDDYIGAGYGIATADELAVQVEAATLTGLIFDPTYTGKALYALRQEIARETIDPDTDVIFWHTGGGFAALATDYGETIR